MNISSDSRKLLKYFLHKKKKSSWKKEKTLHKMTSLFYSDMRKADKFVFNLHNSDSIKITVKEISHVKDIPSSSLFASNSKFFPTHIKKYINTHSTNYVLFECPFHHKKIKLYFILTKQKFDFVKYLNYAHMVFMWLYIADQYSSEECNVDIILHIYMTPFKKKKPNSMIEPLGANSVNSAFTWGHCKNAHEFIIFREEEWFKVLIHESFHNFGLDFSRMELKSINEKMSELFHIQSEYNIFEAYCDYWARLWNSVFISYFMLENPEDKDTFSLQCEYFFNMERDYSIFQCVKVLNHMGLQYSDLYKNTEESIKKAKTLYKETSNVFAYYILCAVLMSNYEAFFSWCNHKNTSLLNFNKSHHTLDSFINYIKTHYKKDTFLESLNKQYKFLEKQKNSFLINNTRMSILSFQ